MGSWGMVEGARQFDPRDGPVYDAVAPLGVIVVSLWRSMNER